MVILFAIWLSALLHEVIGRKRFVALMAVEAIWMPVLAHCLNHCFL